MEAAPNLPTGMSIRIQPTYCVQFMEFDRRDSCRTASQLANQVHLHSNAPRPEVSDKASKRIRNAVNWLASSAEKKRVFCKLDSRTYWFKLNFITLTLPSLEHEITDHQFKNRLLKNFLARMSYRHGLRNYVWRVETQANGNIHAHITSDCFIHWSEIRSVWNDLLIRNGLMKSFAQKHGHSDPNSTDVKAVKSVKDIAAYLAKYFSKGDAARRNVSGKLWSCSHSLSDRNPCSIHLDPQDSYDVTTPLVSSSAEALQVKSEPNSFGHRRHLATLFFMKPCIWKEISGSLIADHFNSRLDEIRTGVQSKISLIKSTYEKYHVKFNYKAEPRKSISEIAKNRAIDLKRKVENSVYEIVTRPASQLSLFG
jgi:hypothetical protein